MAPTSWSSLPVIDPPPAWLLQQRTQCVKAAPSRGMQYGQQPMIVKKCPHRRRRTLRCCNRSNAPDDSRLRCRHWHRQACLKAGTAIDQSLEMLAVAQNTARTEGLPIDFRRASLDHDLPFAQGKFDFLVCALMLCHVADLMHAVQEFFRVLQPGGYLLITAFHPDAIERGWRTNPTIAGIQYLLPNIPHTQTGYIEALTGTGFHILKVIDAIVGEVPDGYLSEAFRSVNENKTLCLIVLAQRPA